MREKLIKLIESTVCDGPEDGCPNRKMGSCGQVNRLDCCALGKIADHLLANGVIVLPCKVGDVLYEPDGEHGVVKHEITDLVFAANSIATDDKGSSWADCWQAEEIKNAPKTREEAEAALKEGKE